MRYLIAIVCPPLAIFLCGRILLAFASGIAWLLSIALVFFFGLGIIGLLVLTVHAWLVISDHKAQMRMQAYQLHQYQQSMRARRP